MIDNYHAVYDITTSLIKDGHKRIGFLGDIYTCKSYYERWKGYRDALLDNNRQYDEKMCAIGKNVDGTYTEEEFLLKEFKAMELKPTAMVCCNDRYAIQFMIGLKADGYQVPEDIAVAGFDNLKESSYFYPTLTTVEGNRTQLGTRAAEQIVKRINSPNEQYELVRLQTTPIYRDSTKLLKLSEAIQMKKPDIYFSPAPVIEPEKGCDWADTMVLNPALVLDEDGKTIHMLFRATGPWPQKNLRGLSDPYPIFLGYAKSEDLGENFQPDFSRPALAPRVAYEKEDMYVLNYKGEKVLDYANGCVEDPRIFTVEDKTYLTVASRLFPPGPYWEKDARRDYLPDWVAEDETPVGVCARRNDTVTVLYELDVEKL